LRVGLIAPPWVPVPPTVYGGTEAVVDQLARGLAAAGCDVRLFTTGDSTCPVEKGSFYAEALSTRVDQTAELAHVQAAYDFLADVDVIHDHTLTGPTELNLSSIPMPVVTTAHGPFTSELRERYRAAAEHVSVIAISLAQRRSAPEIPIAAVIHHGLDVASFPPGEGRGGYLFFLGRMSPDKGAHRAIAVARAAGRSILLAAKMWEPAEYRYFTEVVEPLLGEDAVYVGEVGGPHKLELLGAAEALVNPIRWPEPFGLAMIEALACGTPVLAFPEGAAPEIVDQGRTGFLCTDEEDMASMVDHVRDLDREACRNDVATRFSTSRMVEDHLALYRRLLARRDAATRADLTPMTAVADGLGNHRPPATRRRTAVPTA
jgi:glycosyltransferase involved in cell wall biosynthesis